MNRSGSFLRSCPNTWLRIQAGLFNARSSKGKGSTTQATDISAGHRHLSSLHNHLPGYSHVVICGGGAIGTSVAYHLTLQGWKDIIILEQGSSVACGTTWHAGGLVGRHRYVKADALLSLYSAKLYEDLEAKGYNTGWKKCGSLNMARTKDRLIAYKRALQHGERYGLHGEYLTPDQIKERCPQLNVEGLQGGFFIPGDGVASPTDLVNSLATLAKENGVQIFEKCQVKKVHTRRRAVTGVETDKGYIECKYFVNCAGQWARELGQLCEPAVRVPLHSCEHSCIITKPQDEIDRNMPVIRDYDGHINMREWSGGILGGGFEPTAKPIFSDGIPESFEFQLLPEDWDHFQVLLEQLLHRFPLLEHAEVRQLIVGPESFTPDGKPIIGEAPEVDNYFVAAGMNSSGIAYAGGVGYYLAEWIVQGEPSIDMWAHDIRRFVDMHNNKNFLKARVSETLGFTQTLPYWDRESAALKTGRKLRVSPLYTRMEKHAVFGQSMGYERPLYFSSDKDKDEDDWGSFQTMQQPNQEPSDLYEYMDTDWESVTAFGKPNWFENVKSEYWACREGVCLIDMSTFTKFELQSAGNEVVDFLQYICSNDIDKPVGVIIHTGMQNHHGGYENDCSAVRLAQNRYFLIGPTAQQTRSFAWLKDHLPPDGSVQLSDVTSMYTAINIIGPRAQDLLQELTDTSLAKQDFFSMTCKEIDVGQASGVKAMRLTHSGEDGFMLYIPSEYALHLYDTLMKSGKNYGIRNAGYYALRALRTEKFFAYWGTDLTPHTTPMECGREYRVKFDVGNFIGHGALMKQRADGIKKKLVQFLLDDHDLENDPWPWGGEPIYRNGKYVGTTTSTAYGFTLDRHVCLGYVQDLDEITQEPHTISNDFILKNAKFEIDIAGKNFPAKAGIYPPKLASAEIIINKSPKA